jgi:hypothetical protein
MKNILKKICLIAVFFFILTVNTFCLFKLYLLNKKSAQQEKILREFSQLQPSSVRQFSFSAGPLVLGAVTTDSKLVDGRSANLKIFFRKYNSLLYDFADYIVSVSDKYGFDYRLLPAIAMQESTLCKYIPDNSFNCWGYGIYGNQILKFSSYNEAIETVARGIKDNYIDKGLKTPEAIMSKYTPSSPGSWARGINHSFRLLE